MPKYKCQNGNLSWGFTGLFSFFKFLLHTHKENDTLNHTTEFSIKNYASNMEILSGGGGLICRMFSEQTVAKYPNTSTHQAGFEVSTKSCPFNESTFTTFFKKLQICICIFMKYCRNDFCFIISWILNGNNFFYLLDLEYQNF